MEGNWRDSAKCRQRDPDLFFPHGEKTAADRDQIAKAKAVCLGCAALEQCLTYALETNQDTGVWGGTSASERIEIKRRRRRRNF